MQRPPSLPVLALAALALLATIAAPLRGQSLFGPERLVSPGGGEAAVAVDGGGDFVVVWTAPGEAGETTLDVLAQRFSAAGPALGRAFRVNDDPTGYRVDPAVAADGAGGFVVVWIGGDDGLGTGIFGQLFGPGGERRGGAFQVNTATEGNQIVPAVAMDRAGDFVVAWGGGDSILTQLTLEARRFAADGTPRGPQFRVDPGDRGLEVVPPALAMTPGGGFAVGWSAVDESHGPNCPQFQCFTSRPRLRAYGPDGALHGQLQLDGANAVLVALLGAATEGDYLALWSRGQSIRGRRVSSSGRPVGPSFVVQSCPLERCPDFEAAARDSSGSFVVIVRDGERNLLGRLFQPMGAPAGPTFPVTSLPETSPQGAAVALSDDGVLEVVWRRQSDGTHRPGLFRRLIRP